MALIHRNDSAPNVGEDESGNFTQVFNLAAVPGLRDDYDIFNLTLRYELASMQVLSTTSYVQQDKETRNFGFQLPLAPPPAQPFDVLSPSAKLDAHNFTEELRLQSLGGDPLQWSVGAFHRRARFQFDTASIFGLAGAPGAPLPAPFLAQVVSETRSWAAFGDAHYALTGRFTLGVGLRYFEDDEDYTFGTTQTGTFHALSPRAYAQFRVSDTVNTYASAGKGFRSGGFNGLGQPPYDPENVWTYELGAKTSLAGGRFALDAAFFYTDYEDYQIIGTVPLPAGGGLASITSNAGSAAVKGVEWAVSWRPTSQWTLALSGDYIDSEFYEINAADSSHEVGDRLDLSPRYSFVLSTQRNFTWGDKHGFARVDYSQQGRSTFRNRNIAGPSPWYFSESDVMNMLGVDLALHWNDRLSFDLFAQNVLDDRGFVDALSIQRGASRSRPRTYGVGFNVSFE
jgi:outer membrane receptor protein involved in Fe transport